MPARWCSGKGVLPGLQTATFSLRDHMAAFVRACAHVHAQDGVGEG